MNKLLITLLLVIFNVSAVASELDGEWDIDIYKTSEFVRNNIKMPPLESALFQCSIHNSRLYFSGGKAAFVLKDHPCEYEGKKASIKGAFEDFSYSIIFKNEKQTVLLFKNKDDERIEVINWIGSSLFWLDAGDHDGASRYFYKKLEK